ncbi:DUF6127 family protein [Ferrovibrio terrae]|uniref:DUF6127 family protein n=1 Tax=Ferrovibrio terrae TaxID=2594003 RepID=UPI0031383FC9
MGIEDLRVLHKDDLKTLIEDAAEEGARKALSALGLSDHEAATDLRELRGWVAAVRLAKREAFKTAIKWVIAVLISVFVAGMAVKFGVKIEMKD